MSWLKNLIPSKVKTTGTKKGVPEGVWTKCGGCAATLFSAELERNFNVCPKCDRHMRISARKRLDYFLDEIGREELAVDVEPKDLLKFRDRKKYRERIASAQKRSGEKSALLVMQGYVYALPVVTVVFDFNFIGGSMGSAVGEKFVLDR